MYAITEDGFRAITQEMALMPGEVKSLDIPLDLLRLMESSRKRDTRDKLLRATDWTQMADAPLSAAQKATWALYRQALRDLPSVAGFPDVPWPTPPALNGAAASGSESVQLP